VLCVFYCTVRIKSCFNTEIRNVGRISVRVEYIEINTVISHITFTAWLVVFSEVSETQKYLIVLNST